LQQSTVQKVVGPHKETNKEGANEGDNEATHRETDNEGANKGANEDTHEKRNNEVANKGANMATDVMLQQSQHFPETGFFRWHLCVHILEINIPGGTSTEESTSLRKERPLL
jgi:hypothetical protein